MPTSIVASNSSAAISVNRLQPGVQCCSDCGSVNKSQTSCAGAGNMKRPSIFIYRFHRQRIVQARSLHLYRSCSRHFALFPSRLPKKFGMLREPHTSASSVERKSIKGSNPSARPEQVEGLRRRFSAASSLTLHLHIFRSRTRSVASHERTVAPLIAHVLRICQTSCSVKYLLGISQP
jgi:hypothetical protein